MMKSEEKSIVIPNKIIFNIEHIYQWLYNQLNRKVCDEDIKELLRQSVDILSTSLNRNLGVCEANLKMLRHLHLFEKDVVTMIETPTNEAIRINILYNEVCRMIKEEFIAFGLDQLIDLNTGEMIYFCSEVLPGKIILCRGTQQVQHNDFLPFN